MDEALLRDAIANPRNVGEIPDADAVGTVGSPECGDMVRLWLKFSERDGKKVIDRASFQSFGCQTAIAVASLATEMLRGKTVEEAEALSAADLSAPLGPLPPVKIHCGQMVEGALRDALAGGATSSPPAAAGRGTSPGSPGDPAPLSASLSTPPGGRVRVVPLNRPTP